MTLIKRVDITNGQWMTWVEITPTHAEILWFDHEPTEAEAEAFVADWLTQHQYDETPHQVLSIYDEKEAIEAAVVFIKTTASLTLTKWNNYLATLSFVKKYAVQWFIFKMAEKLAEIRAKWLVKEDQDSWRYKTLLQIVSLIAVLTLGILAWNFQLRLRDRC